MTRFYYQGQEFETTQQQWDNVTAQHATSTKAEHEAVIAASSGHIVTRETGAVEASGHKIINVVPRTAS